MHGTATAAAPERAEKTEKHRTITLTNRGPIRIVEADWPVLAQGACGGDPDNEYVSWSIEIRVREGKHRRYIVHANYHYDGPHDEDTQQVRVGRITGYSVENADLWKIIQEVGEELRVRIAFPKLREHVVYALDSCFAQLPATNV